MESIDAPRMTRVQWLICFIAAVGFAFDIYELLMLPLIVGPALESLMGIARGTPEFEHRVGQLFFIPAFVGGFCGLLGGYLTDRLGRRFVLTYSILLYAFSALAAGLSTSFGWLLVFRCMTFAGVCVEFVAAIAWLAELFPDPRRREAVIGYTQAFSSLGGLLVTGANILAVRWAPDLPAIHGHHEAWRYTLISGVIPALPLILIRPFLPESPIWARKRQEGTLRRPSFREIFAPRFARTTIVTTLMFACSYGAAFGAIQHVPRIVPGLPQIVEATKDMKVPDRKRVEQSNVGVVQTWQEVGGLVGRVLLAMLAVQIVSRKRLLRIFQVPGMIVLPLVFLGPAIHDLDQLKYGIFVVGLLTVAQFSFWGNYLPLVYPTHLRGTGESFAANVGGRMLGTSAALVTTTLAAQTWMPGATPSIRLAYAAALVGASAYVIGFLASFWLPEPPSDVED